MIDMRRSRGEDSMRILMITSAWPERERPERGIAIKQQFDSLKKAGIEAEIFIYKGRRSPRNYFRAWKDVQKLLKAKKFDLMHAQFGQCGLAGFFTGVPLVTTFRGSDLCGIVGTNGRYTKSGKLLYSISRYVAKKSKEVIVVADNLKDRLPRRMHTHLLPPGIDFKLFHPIPQKEARYRLKLPFDKKFILFDANKDKPVKRYELAKKAIDLIKDKMNASILPVSKLPHKLMPLYINASNVLLLTSKHEGSPSIVGEALACNIPVVSANVGDVAERIRNIPGCVVCENDSPQTFANGLLYALHSQEQIEARETIKDMDENILTEKLINIYCLALEKKK